MDDKKKEDDGITIDFGRIKDFFKRHAKHHNGGEKGHAVEDKHEHPQKNDDEISLSFSDIRKKVKGLFAADNSQAEAEEPAVNIQSIIKFFRRYALFFAVLLPVVLSVYIRMQPANLSVVDDWAANSVISSVRSQIMSQINSQYPNLPEANRNTIVESELQRFLRQNKGQIEQQMGSASAYLKSFFQDENGKTYMPDIDPYYWYRYAKNILEKGSAGDEIRDGEAYDTYQLAPLGRPVQSDMLHSYFLAYFYRVLRIFNSDITLMRSSMYAPVIIPAVAVLLAFLIGRKISGNVGGFFSALMLAVNGSFVGRTLFGHADNDMWVVFFPLLITWLALEFYDSRNLIVGIITALVAGFAAGLFSIAWSGWFFITDFIFGMTGITVIYFIALEVWKEGFRFPAIFRKKHITKMLLLGAVFFVSVGAFVTLFNNFTIFKNSILPLSFTTIKEPVRSVSLWPNVLTTVAELNEGSYNQVINSMGGRFLWYVGLAGILLALLKKNSEGRRDIKYSVLLGIWIAAATYASLKGIRFTILVAPAFSIAFGTALGFVYLYFSGWLNKELHVHRWISGSVIIITFLLPYINIANASLGAARGDLPLINDAWYNSLAKIKGNSKENAIITSWWDFGHHFKALADRPVTFDGTTQERPTAHWVGRLFMTPNEAEAWGILRMLDCGQNGAYQEIISGMKNDIHSSIRLTRKIILMDKEGAKKELLGSGFSEAKAEQILKLTHCSPPEAFVIASDDMTGKSGVWSHFGSWNFERADIWFNTKDKGLEDAVMYMNDKFNYTREKAESIYFEVKALGTPNEANAWIAPWPGYGGVGRCSRNSKNESSLKCDNGFQINLTGMDAFAVGQQGIVRPKYLAYPTGDGIGIKEFTGSTVGLGFTLVPKSENEYDVVFSSPELTGSIFTRMFYLNGHGLKYFRSFGNERGYTGTNIYVYSVDWEGGNMTISQDYLNNLKVENAEDG